MLSSADCHYLLRQIDERDAALAAKDAQLEEARAEARYWRNEAHREWDNPDRGAEIAALKAEVGRLREVADAARAVGLTSHSGHWDRTGGAGSGCPECKRQWEWYEPLSAALRALDTPPPSVAPEPDNDDDLPEGTCDGCLHQIVKGCVVGCGHSLRLSDPYTGEGCAFYKPCLSG